MGGYGVCRERSDASTEWMLTYSGFLGSDLWVSVTEGVSSLISMFRSVLFAGCVSAGPGRDTVHPLVSRCRGFVRRSEPRLGLVSVVPFGILTLRPATLRHARRLCVMLKQPESKAITEGFLPRGIRLLLPATDLAVPVGLGRRAVPERVGGRGCPMVGYI